MFRGIKNIYRRKKKKMVINHLEKKGLDLCGLKVGLLIEDVRVTLSDGEDTYYAKLNINGNHVSLSKFERAY